MYHRKKSVANSKELSWNRKLSITLKKKTKPLKQVLPLVLSNLMDWSNFGLAKLQVFSDKHGKIKKIRIFILFGPANALQLWIQQLTLWSWRSTLLHRNFTGCEKFHPLVAVRLLKHRIQSSIYFKKVLSSYIWHKVPKTHQLPKISLTDGNDKTGFLWQAC